MIRRARLPKFSLTIIAFFLIPAATRGWDSPSKRSIRASAKVYVNIAQKSLCKTTLLARNNKIEVKIGSNSLFKHSPRYPTRYSPPSTSHIPWAPLLATTRPSGSFSRAPLEATTQRCQKSAVATFSRAPVLLPCGAGGSGGSGTKSTTLEGGGGPNRRQWQAKSAATAQGGGGTLHWAMLLTPRHLGATA
jgi:hypothetical protein